MPDGQSGTVPTDDGAFAHVAADECHRYLEVLGVVAPATVRFMLHLTRSDVVAAIPNRVYAEKVAAVLQDLATCCASCAIDSEPTVVCSCRTGPATVGGRRVRISLRRRP